MALPQYGATGQTSTITTTGPTRDESIQARGTRWSLVSESNQIDENAEQNERNIDQIRKGKTDDGTANPIEGSNSDVTLMQSSSHTDDVTRHVLFTNDVERQNDQEAECTPAREIEREMERLIDDNTHNVDNEERDLQDSLSRIGSVTNTNVHTHSEAEECNESDFSIAMSLSTDTVTFRRRSRTGSLLSNLLTPRSRRRRRISRPGAIVTDSYADECICCCAIL